MHSHVPISQSLNSKLQYELGIEQSALELHNVLKATSKNSPHVNKTAAVVKGKFDIYYFIIGTRNTCSNSSLLSTTWQYVCSSGAQGQESHVSHGLQMLFNRSHVSPSPFLVANIYV